MAVSALLLSVCFLILTFFIKRKISNPAVLFNLIWSVLILISIIGYSGVLKSGDEIYGILQTGIVSFNLAYLLLSFIGVAVKPAKKNIKGTNPSISKARQMFIIFMQVVLFVYYIIKLFGVVKFLKEGGSYDLIRSYYYSEQFVSSAFEYLLTTFLLDPMITVTMIVVAFNVFDRKYKKSVLLLMTVNIVLRAFISGGRTILVEFFIILIMSYLVYFKDSSSLKKSQKKKVILLCAVTAVFAVVISFGRAGASGGIVKTIIENITVNFTGSFKYLSILLERGLMLPNKTYGAATFAGVYDIFIIIRRFFGLTEAETVQNSIGLITAKFWSIGTYSYNAMPTMYYFFMTDWGKAGIVIGSAILSAMAYISENVFLNKKTYKNLAIYLLMAIVIAESSATWMPFNTSFIMTIVLSLLLFNNSSLSEKS